jgi:hypothetical protein
MNIERRATDVVNAHHDVAVGKADCIERPLIRERSEAPYGQIARQLQFFELEEGEGE